MSMKTFKIAVLLLALCAAGSRAEDAARPEIIPRDMQQSEYESVKDRIYSSLMYRGELADKIIEAGKASEIVTMQGEATYADYRLAVMEWIKKNPEKAARLALNIKSGVKFDGGDITYTVSSWRINAAFMDKIRALNAAAKGGGVSAETMELAGQRLYAGSYGGGAGAVVAGGGSGAVSGGGPGGGPRGGNDFFSIDYADYKLNRAGLERELAGAGGMLDVMRGPSGKGPAGAEKAYESALAGYGSFVVTASALKGRAVISGAESGALEQRRAGLRRALGALALRGRAAELRGISGELAGDCARPGCGALKGAAGEAADRIEADAARIEGGTPAHKELLALVGRAESEFAAFYLKYSVYSGLLGLRKKTEGLGFSCVYDYLFLRWLARVSPGSPYVVARAAAASAAAGLDAGMLKAGEGELEAALEGPGGRAAALEAAVAEVRAASAANRAAQFFLWGMLFRPVEIEVTARAGKPFFWPAFTFYSVTGPRGGGAPATK